MRTDREVVGKPPLVVALAFPVGFKFARHRYHVGRLAHLFGHRLVLGVLLGDPARSTSCAPSMWSNNSPSMVLRLFLARHTVATPSLTFQRSQSRHVPSSLGWTKRSESSARSERLKSPYTTTTKTSINRLPTTLAATWPPSDISGGCQKVSENVLVLWCSSATTSTLPLEAT